ncbi:hypothetical protein [Marinicellulosiphila megalodicopiae]|uniref:hypothetical protein n=1 Tax=Marinicellulosiphila megalodicopiae TaxID=2724896 RepID=UPI003BB1FA8C
MANETFESWLLIPGNHRIILQLKKQVSVILNKPAKIDSWRSLYEYYEVVLDQGLTHAQIFTPVFFSHPPSIELGATFEQVDLYQQVISVV